MIPQHTHSCMYLSNSFLFLFILILILFSFLFIIPQIHSIHLIWFGFVWLNSLPLPLAFDYYICLGPVFSSLSCYVACLMYYNQKEFRLFLWFTAEAQTWGGTGSSSGFLRSFICCMLCYIHFEGFTLRSLKVFQFWVIRFWTEHRFNKCRNSCGGVPLKRGVMC